ncbi:MAG: hypothetical protein H7258_09210, partial [Ferruginibacter sp.]|nr:hypothetical protein [Ferruginibacter sp.]
SNIINNSINAKTTLELSAGPIGCPGGHENPVRAGIVYEPQDYLYSSGIDYYTTKKGMIQIEHLQC